MQTADTTDGTADVGKFPPLCPRGALAFFTSDCILVIHIWRPGHAPGATHIHEPKDNEPAWRLAGG